MTHLIKTRTHESETTWCKPWESLPTTTRLPRRTSNTSEADCVACLQLAAADRDRIYALINSPQTEDYFDAVRAEAAHQIERWGVDHDAGKRAEDWVTLIVYLLGKAAKAHFDGDEAKLKHHIVTVGAVALNWLRNINGESTRMRPGVGEKS